MLHLDCSHIRVGFSVLTTC